MPRPALRPRTLYTLPLLALLTLCPLTAWSHPNGEPAQAAPGGAQTELTEEKVKAAISQADLLATRLTRENRVPGLAIAIVYKGETVFLKGYGVREAGKNDAVSPDTVFQLASLSKPISATVIAALVSDGKVSWDDPISKYFPEFQLSDPWVTRQVTIRDMLSHRSGLPGNAGNDLETLGYGRDEILRRLRYVPVSSAFRSQYSYSNFGLTMGGIAAARAVGKPWEDVAAEKLYKPLGMNHTSSRYDDYARAKDRAVIHVPDGGVVSMKGQWVARFTRQPEAQSPAGGVSSTARDLAQWVRLELDNGSFDGKRIISESALADTHMPLIIRGPNPVTGVPAFYGLGWNIDYDEKGRVYWNHAGAFTLGARTQVKLLPSERLGIIVLSNAFPTGVPEAISDTFFDQALNGKQSRDWVGVWDKLYQNLMQGMAAGFAPYATPPASPAPALPLATYVGSYENAYVGRIEVKEQNGMLTMLMGPQQKSHPLRHWNRDTFVYEPTVEVTGAYAGVRFILGVDGRPTQMMLDTYEGDLGTFTAIPPK